MRLTAYNGGLHTQLAPHLIELNEGVLYENIDNSRGHFVPHKDKVEDTTLGLPKDFAYHFDIANEMYYTDAMQDWVVFKEVLYNCDRVGVPKKRTANQQFENLGIVGPTQAISLAGIGTHSEDVLSYAMTYYNSADGTESQPVISAEINRFDGGTQLTTLEVSTDPQVDQKRIYRIGGGLTTYTLVDTIDNSVTEYLDIKGDLEVEGSLLQSSTWAPAPEGLKYLIEAYAMLFGIVGDQLRYTPIGKPDAWPVNYFIDLSNPGTGIAISSIGLLVFTEHKTILITGTGPTLLAQQSLSEDQGCINHDSITSIKGRSIWTSHDGLCMSNGGVPEVISKGKLGKLDFSGQINNAVAWDETYYLNLVDGRLFVWDFAYNNIPEFQYHDTTSLVLVNDSLYGLDEQKIYRLFASENNLIAKFKTGWLGQGGLIPEKVQDDFLIAFSGYINLKVYVNGEIVKEYTYNAYEFTIEKSKLPLDSTRNNYVEFEITGTGQVFEIAIEEVSANG